MDCPKLIREILDRMAKLRKEHTPRQKKFAEKADINIGHLSSLETNATEVFMSTFLKVCKAMDAQLWVVTARDTVSIFKPEDFERLQLKKGEVVRKKKRKGKKKK